MAEPKPMPQTFSHKQLPKMIEIYKGNLWHARNKLFRTGSPEGNINIHPPRSVFHADSVQFEVSMATGLKGKLSTRIYQKAFKVLPLSPAQQGAVRMELIDPFEVPHITTLHGSPRLWIINGLRLLVQKQRLVLNELYQQEEKELEYATSRESRVRHEDDSYIL